MDVYTIFNFAVWGILFLVVIFKFFSSICLVPTRKAYIVERFGKYERTLGPGFHVLIPFVDKVAFVRDLKEHTIDIPPQSCFTKDEVQVEVDGVAYISVIDPVKASYGVTNYQFAATQLAQTTTRSIIGTIELDRTFEERDLISSKVVKDLAEAGETWGIQVHRYEVRNLTPPPTVKDAMEKQVNAERERRAILARSEGDRQSRINMSEGRKTELINESEGEMQRRINEAEGKAEEILAIARAVSDSIRKVGAAATLPGGEDAIRLQLAERYLGKLGNLAKSETRVILSTDLTSLDKVLDSLDLAPRGG